MQHNEFDLPLNRAPGRHYSKGRKRVNEDGQYSTFFSLLFFLIFSLTFNADEDGDEEMGDGASEVGSEMTDQQKGWISLQHYL